ncbi:MAG: hypothetical protein HYS26_03220 [Candidatus Kaiserbacteria bacterium]|nr:MAG: hypothetical protein HYS26_03220 [Candidatus Kaiserbacteria bacterium]
MQAEKPDFEEFHGAMADALAELFDDDESFDMSIIERMKKEGADFDFASSGIDSLDLLDVLYVLDKRLHVHVSFENIALQSDGKVTMGALHAHTRYRPIVR